MNATPTETRVQPATERATLDRRGTAAALGIAVTTLDRLRKVGRVPTPIQLGSRVVWDRQAVLDFIRTGRVETR